jgi:hypothetical protein
MKGNLIAAGSVLAAAAFLTGMAGPATASSYPAWGAEDDDDECKISAADDSTTLRISPWGVTASHRDADACEDKDEKNPHHHGYWPGHSYTPGWDSDWDGGWDGDWDRGWNGGWDGP